MDRRQHLNELIRQIDAHSEYSPANFYFLYDMLLQEFNSVIQHPKSRESDYANMLRELIGIKASAVDEGTKSQRQKHFATFVRAARILLLDELTKIQKPEPDG